jgi:hypothetical protein
MKVPDPIIVGNFVDVQKPTYHDIERKSIEATLGRSK